MMSRQEKWDALSNIQKAKRQAAGAVFSVLVVVLLPFWVPLDNLFKIICALVVGLLGLMLAFAAGMYAGSIDEETRQ
jgi:hypothetical protein